MKRQKPTRALKVLTEVLSEMSAVRVKEISFSPATPHQTDDILVSIDVYGHDCLLLCASTTRTGIASTRRVVEDLRNRVVQQKSPAVAVLIAPSISGEARLLCRDREICCIDFEGNACIEVDQVFFHKRCLGVLAGKPSRVKQSAFSSC